MTDNPVDLSPLEPDQLRFERATRAILAAASDELERRRRAAQVTASPLAYVARWRLQLVAASALVALPGLLALGMVRDVRPEGEPTLELAAALGVPDDMLPTLREGLRP